MKPKPIATAITFCAVTCFLLIPLLAASSVWRRWTGIFGAITAEASAVCHDRATQWMAVLCLTFYFILFAALQRRLIPRESRRQTGYADCFLIALFALAVGNYAFAYQTASGSTDVLVLLASIIFSKGIFIWMRIKGESIDGNPNTQRFLEILALLLVGTTFWRADFGRAFDYQHVRRWCGPWDNPNLYGLLMGLGVILAAGQLVRCRRRQWQRVKNKWYGIFYELLWYIVAVACGTGLFKSYSRGAWLATAVGIGWLMFQTSKGQVNSASARRYPPWSMLRGESQARPTLLRNWRLIGIIGISASVLVFWQFRFTEWSPARRVFSMANINDFSWRNRITAWEGTIHMMADRPWFGYGWEKAAPFYEENYRPRNLDNGAAIQMNDYFMLGISVGVPALICFFIYVAASLGWINGLMDNWIVAKARHGLRIASFPVPSLGTRHSAPAIQSKSTFDWPQATCRAGAIVLLVGFFFDGGLFKLATGSVFWILLELGRADSYRRGAETWSAELPIGTKGSSPSKLAESDSGAPGIDTPRQRSHLETWLKRSALAVGTGALLQTVVLLGIPFLPVGNATLAIARKWLVPPKAVGDLDFLAATLGAPSSRRQVSETPLKILIQHASLANYDRELINWKVDDKIYCDYVLTPTIESQRDGQLTWRRALWEYFYPPVRHETDPEAAAEIVMEFLRERIAVVPQGPLTIEEMWRQRKADAKGFEALKVAAFRSVGIPARLNKDGQAESWSNEKWQAT